MLNLISIINVYFNLTDTDLGVASIVKGLFIAMKNGDI